MLLRIFDFLVINFNWDENNWLSAERNPVLWSFLKFQEIGLFSLLYRNTRKILQINVINK